MSLDSTKGTQMKLFGILTARWRSTCVCNWQGVNVAVMKFYFYCIKYNISIYLYIYIYFILLFQESVMRPVLVLSQSAGKNLLKKPSYEVITALKKL